jgi:hypothetical protein
VRTAARFPDVPSARGHYESFYLKAAAPEGGRAVWIRHTVHRRPGQLLTGAVWLTWFDAGREGPVALKGSYGPGEIAVPAGAYLRVGESVIAPGTAAGSLSTHRPSTNPGRSGDSSTFGAARGATASWDLRFGDRHEALHHLPDERLYDARLPKTKLLSPHPGALFDGVLELEGERIELAGWPGMVGHNWGSEHADTWTWIHAAGLGEDGAGFLDIAAARIRISKWGPLRTPWLGNGMLAIDGERHRLGGIRPRSTSIDAHPGHCNFELRGDGIRVRGMALAPLGRTVAWEYADPAGGTHDSLNCSIADLDLIVSRDGRPDLELAVEGGAAYELGTGDRSHGVPIQPFADG